MSPATTTEAFTQLLEQAAACLAEPGKVPAPDDDLHREILLPLLPAMLADEAIREHWRAQTATGFVARLAAHLEEGAPPPRWEPGDFEIHAAASYLAGPDARALADTLLSEEPLRDLTAALLNQVLGAVEPMEEVPPVPGPRPRLRYSVARWGMKEWETRVPMRANKA